jgi:hypothetical protein
MLKYTLTAVAVLLLLATWRPSPGTAIPIFSHQYDVSCSKCHSVIPHLNEFGAAFMAEGYRIPGVKPGPAFPAAVKVNLVDSSANQGEGPGGAGLPKAVVDEIEAFTAGGIGSRASYLVEQYIVDGGMPGLTRDAWVIDRLNPWDAKIPLSLQAGSFTLPLPVDPETFRETVAHYAVFDQAVGTNTFNFFDPKIGARLQIGNPLKGLTAQIFGGRGHERLSGLPSVGTDLMFALQDNIGPLALSAFRYSGTRPGSGGPGTTDTFQRTGYGVVWNQWGRLSLENVLVNGNDTDCGFGGACQSSGGFTQIRYAITPRLFALGRYEGTMDPVNGFSRNAVLLLGYGPTENSRITLEDVIARSPQTTHTMNLQYTIAY